MQITSSAAASPPVRAVNLRDLADVLPSPSSSGGGGGSASGAGATTTTPTLRHGRVYRCSQIFAPSLLKELGVRTVIDLRGAAEARRAARHAAKAPSPPLAHAGLRPLHAADEPASAVAAAAATIEAAVGSGAGGGGEETVAAVPTAAEASAVAEAAQIVAVPVEAAIAASSEAAEATAAKMATTPAADDNGPPTPTLEETTLMFDLLPPLQLAREAVRRFPLSVYAQMAARVLTLRDPRPVFSRALADERYVGLLRWNRAVLAGAGPQIGAALRALIRPNALPALVHCMSGKDRTGCISAILLSLSGVGDEAIARDYGASERELRRFREQLVAASSPSPPPLHRELGEEEYESGVWPIPLSESMIAAQEKVALAVLRELKERYGGVEGYLLRKGRMTRQEVDALKKVLVE
jgi:hypothetical protein